MNKKTENTAWKAGKIAILLIAVLAVMLLVFFLSDRTPAQDPTEPSATEATVTEPPASVPQTQPDEPDPIDLGEGILVTAIGDYEGVYMEDGTNESVSDVMMIVIRNESENDLQYAEIDAAYGNANYAFVISNLPAGASAVLLEQNRQAKPEGMPDTVTAKNTVFFKTPMDLCEDVLEISGLDGALNVRNISDADISGEIYVYYKYASTDLYYGGITFRAKVENGLAAGEIRQIMTGHFDPDDCVITMVTYGS